MSYLNDRINYLKTVSEHLEFLSKQLETAERSNEEDQIALNKKIKKADRTELLSLNKEQRKLNRRIKEGSSLRTELAQLAKQCQADLDDIRIKKREEAKKARDKRKQQEIDAEPITNLADLKRRRPFSL